MGRTATQSVQPPGAFCSREADIPSRCLCSAGGGDADVAPDAEPPVPSLLAGLPPGHPALGLGGLGFTAYRLWGHNGGPFLRYPHPALPPPHSDGDLGTRQPSLSPSKDRGEYSAWVPCG